MKINHIFVVLILTGDSSEIGFLPSIVSMMKTFNEARWC